MKLAAMQFKTGKSIAENAHKITKGIEEAAKGQARLLVTQECALCGYPPVEIKSVSDIDFEAQNNAVRKIALLSQKANIYVALGLIQKESNAYRNSILLVSPDGNHSTYDKRALWGWDMENYIPGTQSGVWEIDDLKIGVRICFEVRFPEYFRELYSERVDLAIVSLCDVQDEPGDARHNIIRSHLVSRAIENVFHVCSVNSASKYQNSSHMRDRPRRQNRNRSSQGS